MDTSRLKEINKSKVRTALRSEETSSKNSLSKITGLSVATCGTIIGELIESGEAIELSFAASTGGRRSRQFKYNENYAYFMSLYVRQEAGEQSIVYTISNLYGQIIETELKMIDFVSKEIIHDLIELYQKKYSQLLYITIGIPGVVKEGKINICDIKTLSHLDLKVYLESSLNIQVLIENDVNATAVGYYNKLDVCDESFAYLYYPVLGQPGAGIMIDGNILRGKSHFAGEVGFLCAGVTKKEEKLKSVTETLKSLTCILNPKYIVISGLEFDKDDIEIISLSLTNIIGNEHTPEIIFEHDFHDSYMYGLMTIGLNHYIEEK